MRRILGVSAVICLAVAAYWFRTQAGFEAGARVLDLETVRVVLPQTGAIQAHEEPFRYYAVHETDRDTGEKHLAGYAFLTTDAAPAVSGYIGPIVTLVSIDLHGAINGIRVLSHRETPSYAYGIDKEWWLEQFIGLKASSPISPEKDIDGLSSATVSVRAICQSVRQSLSRMQHEVLEAGGSGTREAGTLFFAWDTSIGILILLFAASVISFIRGMHRLRTAILLISFAYLGIKLKLLFSATHILAFLKGTLPSPGIAVFLWVFLVLILITGLLWGRIYCGYLCPFGTLQDLVYKLSPRRNTVPAKNDRRMKIVKYYALFSLLICALLVPNLRISNFEPFALAFTLKGSTLLWIFTAAVLLPGLLIERFYCRYFCLAGAFFAVLNRFSLFGLRFKPACANCLYCEAVCRTGAIRDHHLDWIECVGCNRCRLNCPRGSIELASRLGTRSTPKSVSTTGASGEPGH